MGMGRRRHDRLQLLTPWVRAGPGSTGTGQVDLSRARVTLLCLSSRRGCVLEESVEVAGEVAFEAADRFATSLAFLDATLDVGDRRGVGAASGDEDHVQCAIELPVAAAVEAVADCLPGAGGDRCAAGEPCECRFGADASGVRPGEDELRGSERPNPGLFEQLWCELACERLDLAGELALFGCQLQHASCNRAQCEQRAA